MKVSLSGIRLAQNSGGSNDSLITGSRRQGVFSLSLPERGQLIHDLIINIDGENQSSGDFEIEIQKRIRKIKSGKAVGMPAEDVFSKIEAKYR